MARGISGLHHCMDRRIPCRDLAGAVSTWLPAPETDQVSEEAGKARVVAGLPVPVEPVELRVVAVGVVVATLHDSKRA